MKEIDYRIARGWSEQEVRERLRGLGSLSRNFDAAPESPSLTLDHGWNQVTSQSLVAAEPPGDALPDGPFAQLRRGLSTFAFSDPRIVTVHCDAAAPLLGRRMLLELHGPGIRVLSPVEVSAVRDRRRVYGFSFDTLEGHVERGREWFLLRKDPASGEIRFRIQAAWQPGELPAWMRLGFGLVGRRYQRAWHRRAHGRLRAHLFTHSAALSPVEFSSTRALVRGGARIEKEREANAS